MYMMARSQAMRYLVLLCAVKTLVGNECRYRYVILMTVTKMANKGQIPLRYLVADRSEVGDLEFGLSSSSLAAS